RPAVLIPVEAGLGVEHQKFAPLTEVAQDVGCLATGRQEWSASRLSSCGGPSTVPTLHCVPLRPGRARQSSAARPHFNVTEHPTAEWTVQQIVDAFPEETASSYLLRDRDQVYGHAFRQRATGMRILEVLTAALDAAPLSVDPRSASTSDSRGTSPD